MKICATEASAAPRRTCASSESRCRAPGPPKAAGVALRRIPLVFKAAIESKLIWLAVLGLLNSAVAAYYYLRILVVMYMQEPSEAVLNMEPLPAGFDRSEAEVEFTFELKR